MVDQLAANAIAKPVDAFNTRDLDALISGFAPDAVWITGTSTARGHTELRAMSARATAHLRPALTVTEVLADSDRVACQMTETLTVDGTEKTVAVASFFRLAHGHITSAKIYREGSATTA